MSIERGSIVWVDLGVGTGSEQTKRRPAVVVSNNGANLTAWQRGRGVITLIPLTSGTRKPFPFQVALSPETSGLPSPSIAQAEQVRSVDVNRITPTSVVLGKQVMEEIDRSLSLHLELW